MWSATSFTELRRDGLAADRWNLLHPEAKPKVPYVDEMLQKRPAGPVVAASDYMKTFADQIRPFIPKDRVYRVLGADGFGRSDSRAAAPFLRGQPLLRRHRGAERPSRRGVEAADAIKKYGIDPEKSDLTTA